MADVCFQQPDLVDIWYANSFLPS